MTITFPVKQKSNWATSQPDFQRKIGDTPTLQISGSEKRTLMNIGEQRILNIT